MRYRVRASLPHMHAAPQIGSHITTNCMRLQDLRIQCRQRQLSPAGGKEALAERVREHMVQSGDYALYNEDGSVMADEQSARLFGLSSTGTGNNYGRPDGQNVGNFLGERPSSRVLAAPGGQTSVAFGETPAQDAATASAPTAQPQENEAVPAELKSPKQTQEDKKASFLNAMAAKIAGHSSGAPVAASTGNAQPAQQNLAQAMSSPVKHSQSENEPSVTNAASPSQGNAQNNYSRPEGQNVGNFLTDKPSSRVLAPPGGKSNFRLG